MPEANEASNSKIHGKKIYIDRVPESSNCRLGGDPGSIIQQPPVVENLPTHNIGQSNNMISLRPKPFAAPVDASVPPASPSISQQQLKYQTGVVGNPRLMQQQDHHGPGGPVLNNAPPGASPDMMMNSYADNNINSAVSSLHHGKREGQDGQISPLSSLSKRSRLTSMGGHDGSSQHQQHIGPPHMDGGFNGLDSQWKNTLLQQHSLTRGIQYANTTGMQQKYPPQQMFEGGFNQDAGSMPFNVGQQQGIRYGGLKEEPVETERTELGRNKNDMQHMVVETEINHMDSQQQSRPQQRLPPQQIMRSSFPPQTTTWNSLGQPLETNISRKEDQFSKRKLVQSPRVSAGGLPQSPLSSKSGEFSSGSIGPQFGAGLSQKDKSAVTSVHAVGSLTSSANESMQRQQQHQAQMSVKRRTNSLPKTTPVMSGVGSPASVSNMGVPFNASSPSVGTPPLADQAMLERFSKIETLSVRYYVIHLN